LPPPPPGGGGGGAGPPPPPPFPFWRWTFRFWGEAAGSGGPGSVLTGVSPTCSPQQVGNRLASGRACGARGARVRGRMTRLAWQVFYPHSEFSCSVRRYGQSTVADQPPQMRPGEPGKFSCRAQVHARGLTDLRAQLQFCGHVFQHAGASCCAVPPEYLRVLAPARREHGGTVGILRGNHPTTVRV
jgi:hypothetical protein